MTLRTLAITLCIGGLAAAAACGGQPRRANDEVSARMTADDEAALQPEGAPADDESDAADAPAADAPSP